MAVSGTDGNGAADFDIHTTYLRILEDKEVAVHFVLDMHDVAQAQSFLVV